MRWRRHRGRCAEPTRRDYQYNHGADAHHEYEYNYGAETRHDYQYNHGADAHHNDDSPPR